MMKTSNATLDAALAQNVVILADLYAFEFREGTQRWTSFDVDVTDGVNTWSSIGPVITREQTRITAGLSVDTLGITMAPGAIQISGASMNIAAIQGSFDNIRVLVQRAYMTTPGVAANLVLTVFDGTIAEVRPGSTEIALTVKSGLAKLSDPVPRRLIQPQCPYRFGDVSCGVALASWIHARTVAAGSTTTVVKLSASSTNANVGGYLHFTSGALSGVYRTIKAVSGVDVTVNLALPSVPATGVSLDVVKGCDKTRTACRTFSNIARFGGFPDAPKPEAVK
jgi:uncharacterized phage protein (TIGR02218 family)